MRLVRDVLGADVIGAYLHGSAVLDGLRPSSDVDVLVVSRRHTTVQERRDLVDGLLTISGFPGRDTNRPVELTIVVDSDICPWRYPPRSEFQYGEWLREEFQRGTAPSPAPDPDLAPLITMVLLGGTPLFGPPPGELLDPVPHDDLCRALIAGIPDLLAELETDTRNVVLTLARVWATLATGVIKSKDGAADWALVHLPEQQRPVLHRARAVYLGHARERWADLLPRVRPHAEHVVDRIERLTAQREQGLRGTGRLRCSLTPGPDRRATPAEA